MSLWIVGTTTGIAGYIASGPKSKSIEANKRRELEAERDTEPLYIRAKLILDAIHDYRFHCDKYRAWCAVVSEKLRPADEARADQYHAFISHANDVISKGIKNFLAAAELHKRQLQYTATHPELTAGNHSTALTELVSLLDEPIDAPEMNELIDPVAALDHEENLAELGTGFQDQELEKKFAALEAPKTAAG